MQNINQLNLAEHELRIYQLTEYIRKHGFNCYISDGKLYMEVEIKLPSGLVYTDTVIVNTFNDVNNLMRN